MQGSGNIGGTVDGFNTVRGVLNNLDGPDLEI